MISCEACHFFPTAKYRAKCKVCHSAGVECDGRRLAKCCEKSQIAGEVATLTHFEAKGAPLVIHTNLHSAKFEAQVPLDGRMVERSTIRIPKLGKQILEVQKSTGDSRFMLS